MSSIEKSNNYWSVEMKTLEKVLKLPFENPEMTEEIFIPSAILFLDVIVRWSLGIPVEDISADLTLLGLTFQINNTISLVKNTREKIAEDRHKHLPAMLFYLIGAFVIWIICLSSISRRGAFQNIIFKIIVLLFLIIFGLLSLYWFGFRIRRFLA
jgi:glucan phosphoethanolaminetransferase (alkaline phosphatase superfamily)